MYSQEDRTRVLEQIAAGESLRSICQKEGLPHIATVMRWLEDETFREQYAHAIDMRARVKFEELDDVSEDAAAAESAVKIAGLRLKSDNIKWQLARMHARYGDKITTEHTGSIEHAHTVGVSAETSELLASLKAGSSGSGHAGTVPD